MPGNPNPVLAPYNDKSANEMIAFIKTRQRLAVADANEIRNTDFSGQFGGLYVRDLRFRFDLDTESVARDDGTVTIIDALGNHFIKNAEAANDPVVKIYTAADIVSGSITIVDDIDRALFDCTSTANVVIPLASTRLSPRLRDLLIKDIGGHANGYPLTPVFSGSVDFDGTTGSSFIIASDYGSLTIEPKSPSVYYRIG